MNISGTRHGALPGAQGTGSSVVNAASGITAKPVHDAEEEKVQASQRGTRSFLAKIKHAVQDYRLDRRKRLLQSATGIIAASAAATSQGLDRKTFDTKKIACADQALRDAMKSYAKLAKPGDLMDAAILDALAACSPTLTAQLTQLRKSGWRLRVGQAGMGSCCAKHDKAIVIDPAWLNDPKACLLILAHESEHALRDEAPDYSSKTLYLRSTMREEGMATLNEMAVLDEAGEDRFHDGYLAERQPLLKAYRQYRADHDLKKACRECGEFIFDRYSLDYAGGNASRTYRSEYGERYDRHLANLDVQSRQLFDTLNALDWALPQATSSSGLLHPDFPRPLIDQLKLLGSKKYNWKLAVAEGGIDFTRRIISLSPRLGLNSMRQVQHLAHQAGQALCKAPIDISTEENFIACMLKKEGMGIVTEFMMQEAMREAAAVSGSSNASRVGNHRQEDQPRFQAIYDAYCQKKAIASACNAIGECRMPEDPGVSDLPVTYADHYAQLYRRLFCEIEEDEIALKDIDSEARGMHKTTALSRMPTGFILSKLTKCATSPVQTIGCAAISRRSRRVWAGKDSADGIAVLGVNGVFAAARCTGG